MITNDLDVNEESLEMMTNLARRSRRDVIIAHCRNNKDSLARDGPPAVKAYAREHFAEIRSREQQL
jgi:hypothetical protein